MLSNLIVTTQQFVVIIDDTAQEKISQQILTQLLKEQRQDEVSTIKILPFSTDLKYGETFVNFSRKCKRDENKCNVILPPLADLLVYQSAEKIIEFIHSLLNHSQVQRVFLWITPANIVHPRAEYLVAAFEYLADLIVELETNNTLSIVTRKAGGAVTNKLYRYTKNNKEFLVEEIQKSPKTPPADKADEPTTNPVGSSTFKIELNEDEMVARNTLKLPYEKTSETKESSIIYTPDAGDDFDEEDPDEDLMI